MLQNGRGAVDATYGGPWGAWDWPGEALGWLDRHAGALGIITGLTAAIVAGVAAYIAAKSLRTALAGVRQQQAALELQEQAAARAEEPILRAQIGEATDEDVEIKLTNVGLGPAVDVIASPREFPGSTLGVPVDGDSVGALLPGREHILRLGRFPPADMEAESEFDVVYSDSRQTVVKRQLWRFTLGHDVVTVREFSSVTLTIVWPEITTLRERLIDDRGMVVVPPTPIHGDHDPDQLDDPGGLEIAPDNLSSAWLHKYGSYLAGSTRYVQILRALEERRAPGSTPPDERDRRPRGRAQQWWFWTKRRGGR